MDKLSFAIDNIELVNENPNSSFAILSLDFFASGKNRHDMFVKEDVLRKTAKTIYNCPVLWKYDKSMDDAGSHEKDEVPCGFVPYGQTISEKKLSDGRVMLTTLAYVWKKYSGKLLDIYSRDKEKSVSVEMSVLDSLEMADGLISLEDYVFEGVTILGTFIQPAIDNTTSSIIKFSANDEKKEYASVFSKEFVFSSYENIDFTIPKKVKENAKQGLELRKEYGRGSTSVGIATAKYLVSNDKATPEKVKQISKYFPRHEKDNLSDKTSNGWIAWLNWGGDAGRSWSNKLVKQMNEKDETNMSFFSDNENVLFKIDSKEETIVTEEEKKAQEEAEKEKMSVDAETPEPEKDFAEEVKPAPEKDEEESEEPKEQDEPEKDEPKEEDMSLDAYADVSAMLAMLESETEESKSMANMFAEKREVDWAIMAKGLYKMACKMAEDSAEKEKAYMAENELLMAFKKGQEQKEFNFAVAGIISKVEEILPADKLDEVKESVKNFSLETFEDFKNKTLALAFEYGKDKKKEKEEVPEYVSYAFPVIDNVKVTDSLWG